MHKLSFSHYSMQKHGYFPATIAEIFSSILIVRGVGTRISSSVSWPVHPESTSPQEKTIVFSQSITVVTSSSLLIEWVIGTGMSFRIFHQTREQDEVA
jgi:hypothetical protein